MRIREFQERDMAALTAMHSQQGFEYPLPELTNPLFVSKLVLEDDGDTASDSDADPSRPIVMASLVRLTSEAYLLADPTKGTPRDRYLRMLMLQRAGTLDLQRRGLEDVHAWLPPRIARRFGRRLTDLGWVRDDHWVPYSLKL
jgi:hypothetical protein